MVWQHIAQDNPQAGPKLGCCRVDRQTFTLLVVATHRRILRAYGTSDGRVPFLDWLESLKDVRRRAAIRSRLDRLEAGNPGDCHPVGGGVSELRVHFGPGYRVYFGEEGEHVALLLCGGAKRTQQRDIERAKAYWVDYRSRKDA